MKCPGCGYENLAGADACENCGTSLTQEDVPQAGTEVERSLMEDPIASLKPVTPLTVERHVSLGDAIQMMRNHGIGCVLVTGDGGRLAGILTERDLLQKVAGQKLDLGQVLCPIDLVDVESLAGQHLGERVAQGVYLYTILVCLC